MDSRSLKQPEPTHALIWHDTHTDPEIVVGTKEECQRLLVRRALEYLKDHRIERHRAEARALKITQPFEIQVHHCARYLNEETEYQRAQIEPLMWARDALEELEDQ